MAGAVKKFISNDYINLKRQLTQRQNVKIRVKDNIIKNYISNFEPCRKHYFCTIPIVLSLGFVVQLQFIIYSFSLISAQLNG